MAKWVNQRMDIEYDGQGNVFLGVLCFRAEFLSELCFLSKGRKTIEMYMAKFCAAHVRTDVNTKGKEKKRKEKKEKQFADCWPEALFADLW